MTASQPSVNPLLIDGLLQSNAAHTIDDLARRLSYPPAEVRRELNQLTRIGCALNYDAQGHVRLDHASPAVWSDYLEWAGGDRWRIHHYRRTTSTQDVARSLASHTASDDARSIVVVAQEQTAGRGRLGRQWIAPPGTALTFSRVITEQPDSPSRSGDHLTLLSGVTVARAVEAALGTGAPSVHIHWPNDIMVNQRKLAGILVETFTAPSGRRAAVVGIGLNVGLTVDDLPDDIPELAALRERITSFAMLGVQIDRLLMLRRVLEALDDSLRASVDDILTQWRRRDHTIGSRIEALTQGTTVRGEVIDLDAQAGLILRTDTGSIIHLPAATSTILRTL